ncbi:MAG TPA: hypothetical protein VF846_07510 [Thermoanaerobaculia bacterium]|jgi:hypothetical protein
MKRLGWLILVATLCATMRLTAAETYEECQMNCPAGANACTECCSAQYDAANGPCAGACEAQQRPCLDAVWAFCANIKNEAERQRCVEKRSWACMSAWHDCEIACHSTVQIAGDCPGEAKRQVCPYNCQRWAMGKCVGAPVNYCGNTLRSDAPAEAEVPAEPAVNRAVERAKASAAAAAAQTKKLEAELKKNRRKSRRR